MAQAATDYHSRAIAAHDRGPRFGAPTWLAVLLIVGGAAGLTGAFALAVERIHLLLDPTANIGCDFSPFVTCSTAMVSEQGSLFGFPNPFIGLMAFPAPIIVGAATLAGARFARWFWIAFASGMVAGLAFVLWLPQQSIYVLGIVCPWCFLVWMAMYAMFFPLIVWTMAAGITATGRVQHVAARCMPWAWVLSLALAIIVVLALIIRIPEVVTYFL